MSSAATQGAVSYQTTTKRSEVPREFFVTVELYLSPKAAAGLRKVCPNHCLSNHPVDELISHYSYRQPHLPRKKTEKRDSIKQPSGLVDDSQKKLRG
jgi:hypothetical protein